MKIAPNQRQELDLLRDTLNKIDSVVDRKTRQNYRELRERLDGWAAKVAVIGQVKAGKSSFLNAFLHQDDFLPSDVNPWTSVVTNIRINMPKDPVTGARFEFFSEADWQEIIEGGTKIRELTEQLLPGFDTDLLRKQSEEMRERAQRRLGKHYRTLLGNQHDYDFLTPDLLKRYVCAGPGSDDGLERQSLGRYAALTKVANVYMRLPEFQVPTIITDTPGVNDPFLVRDEFTCRSLDKSDVFIVVLSAHQPLTDVDVALIRILAKQDSKDVLIFVNRIDELDDYHAEVPRVIEDVSHRLHEAIPDMEFQIVAGSAHLANLTLQDGEEAEAARAAADTPELTTYIRNKYHRVPEDRTDRLLLASGLGDVKRMLSAVIDNGVGSRQIGHLLGDIRAEMNATRFVTKRERDTLQAQIESVRDEIAQAAAEEIEADIAGIQSIQDQIEQHLEHAEAQVEKVLSKSWSRLEASLHAHIETLLDEQREVLNDRLFNSSVRGNNGGALEISLTPLQQAMEREVSQCYAKSRAGNDIVLSNCMHACRQAILQKFDDPTQDINLENLPYDQFTSTMTMARHTLRLELITERGWAFWRKPTLNIDKTLAALRTIAAEELRPSVEKILSVFNEAQVDRATAGISRVQVMLRMIEVTLSERSHALKKDKVEYERLAAEPERRRALAHRLQSNMEVLERRLLNLSALDGVLSRSELAAAA